ncbi:magnesium transporter [Spirochaeta africana]|uniref:Magnesium transporter MgtE n=1 Tax=Spirochaeta africana (strain ATCC 700263 / DSM 8902 / Z-7692) TaxID=889378 RepID=H9UM65_SPIAZ|nr:magnesium transporter [Spirochaeta africana]AFG38608.1 Mg2+ transporter MgtE [Spirochaeta africana DSM 8902]
MDTTFTPSLVHELIETENYIELVRLSNSIHPITIAEALIELEPEDIWKVLTHLPPSTRAEVFVEMEEQDQLDILETLSARELTQLFNQMSPDDRADLFNKLDEATQNEVLRSLAQAEREDIRRLSSYEEGTAGSIMTSDYICLAPETTAGETIHRLRTQGPKRKSLYYIYVVDKERRLLGFVSLRDVILAPQYKKLGDMTHRDIIVAHVQDDQEDSVQKIAKYDLMAIPVVNEQEILVGVITSDDAIDVMQQENTEDIEKLMAISGSHSDTSYLNTPIWEHFKRRVPWIVALSFVGLLAGIVVETFEDALTAVSLLAVYMPMVADTGGNTGSQSASLIIRSLALQQLKSRNILRVLLKELSISLLLSAVIGILVYSSVVLRSPTGVPDHMSLNALGMAIALALSVQVVSATLIGAILPLTANALKFDPAVVASPALTTTVDITGLLIYFFTAKTILGL